MAGPAVVVGASEMTMSRLKTYICGIGQPV